MIVGLIIGVILVCLLLAGLLYWKLSKQLNLNKLPEEVRIHYQQFYDSKLGKWLFFWGFPVFSFPEYFSKIFGQFRGGRVAGRQLRILDPFFFRNPALSFRDIFQKTLVNFGWGGGWRDKFLYSFYQAPGKKLVPVPARFIAN
jgi:hypothetical protein